MRIRILPDYSQSDVKDWSVSVSTKSAGDVEIAFGQISILLVPEQCATLRDKLNAVIPKGWDKV